MFKKQETRILLGLVAAAVIYLYVNREHFSIERLTGNAPKELPLPSQLKHSEPTGQPQNPEMIDKREIPGGYSNDSGFLLSPDIMSSLAKKDNKSLPDTDQQKMKDRISSLEKEVEDLKKQLNK